MHGQVLAMTGRGTFEASDSNKRSPGTRPFKVVEREVAGHADANTILHITTTDTTQSVELALQQLGYGYDLFYGQPLDRHRL